MYLTQRFASDVVSFLHSNLKAASGIHRKLTIGMGLCAVGATRTETCRANSRFAYSPLALLGTLLALVWFTPLDLRAADGYKKGDSVQVFLFNRWWKGTVVQTNPRGGVMADCDLSGNVVRQVFSADQVRFEYEADSLARGRQWSDASGSFKIKAALIEFVNESVKLRKEDKTEITVPVAKLSAPDQDFLKRLKKDLGSAVVKPPVVPPPERFNLEAGMEVWKSWSQGNDDGRNIVEPDPVPAFVKFKQAGVTFMNDDSFDELGTILPLGGPNGWVLASVENRTPRGALPTRLLWVSLEKRKVENQQLLPPHEILLDYHAKSKQLLTYTVGESRGIESHPPVLSLWKAAPTDTSVELVARWQTGAKELINANPWGRILDATTVLERWSKSEFVAWDVANKCAKYRLSQESFFAPLPELSGGRRYLVLPEDKQVRILETVNGALVSTYPAPNGSSGVALSEDGERLAVLDRNSLTVWDLRSRDAEPNRYRAESIGSPFASRVEWVSSDRIMVNASSRSLELFSLSLSTLLWKYDTDIEEALFKRGSGRTRQIIDGHLVYSAPVRDGGKTGSAVGAVKLPGPKVEDAVAGFDPESTLLINAGTELSVNIQCGEHNERVYNAVRKIAAANGWVLNQNAPLVIYCEAKFGEQQTVTYRSSHKGDSQSVTFTPLVSNFFILRGKEVVWQQGSFSGAPNVVRLDANQSVQTEVNRWKTPNIEFFERLEVPARIFDPQKQKGLGSSKVTNRGLIAN